MHQKPSLSHAIKFTLKIFHKMWLWPLRSESEVLWHFPTLDVQINTLGMQNIQHFLVLTVTWVSKPQDLRILNQIIVSLRLGKTSDLIILGTTQHFDWRGSFTRELKTSKRFVTGWISCNHNKTGLMQYSLSETDTLSLRYFNKWQ